MKHYPYLIIGGGMTAASAIKGIREIDPESEIGLFSQEPHRPYLRPPLSKGLWKSKKTVDQIFMNRGHDSGVDYHLAMPVARLDPASKTIETEDGQRYSYDRLLLATGGRPRRLPFDAPGILYFRTLDDYQALRSTAGPGKTFAVIGGGFIGAELAAALCLAGSQVTMIFPEEGLGRRIFPLDLSRFLNDYYRQQGVELLPGEMLSSIDKTDYGYHLVLKSGREVWADEIVAGIGLLPNTALAEAAGLTVTDGILVDEHLHASRTDIFAAGDVANFYAPVLGKHLRVEHEDNALRMGLLAGHNMARSLAGEPLEAYHHLPYFYSDLFDLGYEAVGSLDSRLETVVNWQEPYRKGVIYYHDHDIVRGLLLWNVWGKLEEARELIGESLESVALLG
jgi:NADPH-dependent 2,4-dienoyl-CoA reductase/sulfur reductase-like enzyme